jgi:pimeloyl-ACP methyl ester carboxylesterase
MVSVETFSTPACGSSQVSLPAADGLHLALEYFGDRAAPTVVFAHGFGQTRQAWHNTALQLATQGWCCISADGRGHGDSAWLPNGDYSMQQFTTDLIQIARECLAPPVLVGASMGGLLALAAEAEAGPGLFRALVLVDITPRWETAGVERILKFMRAYPDGFADLDEAAAAIRQYLPQRRESTPSERLRKYLVPRDDGRLRWHWDPRLLDIVAGDSTQQQADLAIAARTIRIPTLLISGSESDIVSSATIDEFLALVPHAKHVAVPRATHMLVGDRNDAFTDAVLDFIQPLREKVANPQGVRP